MFRLAGLLTMVLAVLKLVGYGTFSWWVVLSPLAIGFVIWFLLVAGVGLSMVALVITALKLDK